MPSRRRQISTTADDSASSPNTKSGFTARARSTNSSTAADPSAAATSSDGTGHNCSAPTRSPSRDVVMILIVVVWVRIVSTRSAAAPRRCSQLSNTSSRRRPERAWARLSVMVSPAWGVTPNAVATTSGTAAGSPTGANSTSHSPSANSPASSAATWIAMRVLPTPPTPVRVTSRWALTCSASSFTATSRPTKLVVCPGRFPGTASIVRNGAKSTRNRGAATWYRCSTPDKSRRRCSPRSISSTPDTTAAVDAATRIWPPWPADITRAVRFNTGPK